MGISSIYDLINQGDYDRALENVISENSKSPKMIILKSLIYREKGEYTKSISVIRNLLENESITLYDENKILSQDYLSAKIEELYTKWRLGEYDETIQECEFLINTLETKDLNDSLKLSLASLYKIKGNVYSHLGEYFHTLSNHKVAATIYEELEDNHNLGLIYNNLGYSYLLMGEIILAEEYLLRSINLEDKIKQQDFARSLSNYGILLTQKGEYDLAHEHLHRALLIQRKINNRSEIAYTLFELITLAIVMDNADESESLLDDLRSQFEQFPDDYVSLMYELAEAIVKKNGKRFKSKLEAANLLNKIIEKPVVNCHLSVMAMKLLCEILLEELQIYENIEILKEINVIVSRLEEMGHKDGSSWVLNEALLLKSKLFLIENNVSDAIETLLNAQSIAEEKGLTQIAHHISNVYNDLKYQLAFWEELDMRNASLKERLDQSDIIGLVRPLQSKSVTYQFKDTENPIMLLIIGQGGVVKLRHKFGSVEGMHEHLIGGFLSAINSFFLDIFTEKDSLDRIRSKGFTILMKSTPEFLYCYIFKGQSLFAAQKLESFVKEIMLDATQMTALSSVGELISPEVKDKTNILPIITKFFSTDNHVQ
ncbi:MAG: tetratricopeptide repeat protein [Candidatus Heimdallarchaeota archaeon]|nr:tetratricopeptide repeat protein [Candidatus Heimdallarchaeota archaeon]